MEDGGCSEHSLETTPDNIKMNQYRELDLSPERGTFNEKLFLFLFIFLLLPLNVAASTDKIVKDSIISQDKARTFYLFVPENVKVAKPAPLILLLHGSGRNGLSLVEKWKDLARKEGIILVGPNATDSSHWSLPGDGPNFLHDLVETLKSKYPINPRRVYLFGHSAGATFALYMSLLESEYFAATAIHAGALHNEDTSLMDYGKRKIPIAIFVGTRDQFLPLAAVRATREALNSRGFAVELTEMPGYDHWYYDLAPKINLSSWEFLKKYELAEDPKYAEYDSPKAEKEINREIGEINELTNKANDLMRRFNAKEEELKKKDNGKEREAIVRVAREEINLLIESEAVDREIVLIAERLIKMNPKGINPQYFSLIAQLERKRAESVQTMRDYAEFLLSDQPHNTITIKRNEAILKAERLQQEADELERQATRLRAHDQ